MVYNGILMETIRISVMVSIELLLFFIAGLALAKTKMSVILVKKCLNCLKHQINQQFRNVVEISLVGSQNNLL